MKNAMPVWNSGVHIKNRGFSVHSYSMSWITAMVAIDYAVLGFAGVDQADEMTWSGGRSAAISGCGANLAI